MVQECFTKRYMPSLLNRTLIVLITKTKNPSTFNHFRLISLCNFVYKIVVKILAARLRMYLGKIISPNQGAFVEGKWIAENTIVMQEMVHKVKSYKGKKGLMVAQVDIRKAYDSLKWGFLDLSL